MVIKKNNISLERKIFSKKFKEIRQYKGFTIKELAEKSGVSSGYISDIEIGRNCAISKEKFEKIIHALDPLPEEEKYNFYITYIKMQIPKKVFDFIIKKDED